MRIYQILALPAGSCFVFSPRALLIKSEVVKISTANAFVKATVYHFQGNQGAKLGSLRIRKGRKNNLVL